MKDNVYRLALESAMDAFFIHGADGKFIEVNAQACKSLGYSREECRALSFQDISKGYDPAGVASIIEQVRAAGTVTIEDVHVRKDGSTFPVEVRVGVVEEQGDTPLLLSLARDISERKRSERSQRAQEERFKVFFQSVNDAIFVHPYRKDGFATFIEVNDFACLRYGYSREEFLTRSVADIAMPGYVDNPLSATHREQLATNGHTVFEAVHRNKSGEQFPVEINANIVDQSGEGVILSVVRDVTERKLAEAKLRESEAKNRAIIDAIPDMMFSLTSDGVFTDYKAKCGSKLFAAPSDFIGKSVAEVFEPELVESIQTTIKEALRTQVMQVLNYQLTVGGELGDYEARIVLSGEDQVLVIVRDVSENKKAKEALEKERQHFEDIFEGTNAGTWYWNVQTGETSINERWAGIMGKTVAELEPVNIDTWSDNTHPDDLKVATAMLEQHFSGERDYYDVEFRQSHKNGEWVWVNARGKVVEWTKDGKPLRMLGTHLDITERKKAEEMKLDLERQVQHAQKLESLGVLAGGIAHDFNNILMGVLGNAELAMMNLSPESPVRENLKSIEAAAVRAADLARQMLAYSGKGRFFVESISVNRMVKEMIHLLKVTISKNAVLKFNLTEEIPNVEADVTQLRQVFMNLVTNASEAIGDKSGVIAVSTGVMDVGEDYLKGTFVNDDVPPGCYTFIEVSDTGCGMDEETNAKIFDPFFTTKFTGRGLGMAATLGIIRGHKGGIRVYSEPQKGTAIKILFPCSELADEELLVDNKPPVVPVEGQGEGTILVVDDEETVCAIAKQTLTGCGFTVLTADDGEEGLRVFEEDPDRIALVILDMTMPRMGGEETFSAMRRIRPALKVVLSSGYNEQEATNRFAGKGLSGFIQKPYRPSELVDKVYGLLEPDGDS